MENEDIFDGLGVEVKLKNKDDFLKVKETLTRMGVSSKKEKKLYQSCHILHKRGRYAIMHFKEMLDLDGLETDIDDTPMRVSVSLTLRKSSLVFSFTSTPRPSKISSGSMIIRFHLEFQ